MLFDMKEVNTKLKEELEETLRKGIPIVYRDDTLKKDELIREYPDGKKIVFKVVDGKEIIIREL